jgi:ribonuclease-3
MKIISKIFAGEKPDREMDFAKLGEIFGHKIKNKNLFVEAATHKSFSNENRAGKVAHNERLEFLGDAVLELIASQFLFKKFPRKPEGELTALRAALVCGKNLARISKKLNLGKFLFLSRGETAAGGNKKNHILANTFEAFLGALFLDANLKICEKFLNENLFGETDRILRENLHKDPKSLFQEIAQEKEKITPHFKLISAAGPDHEKNFLMGAFLNEKKVGEGNGSSKQKAEIAAAENALKNLKWKQN